MPRANFLGSEDHIPLRNTVVYLVAAAARTVHLEPHQRTVIAVFTADVRLDVVLPSVAVCKGSWFFIHKNSADGDIYVGDEGDDGQLVALQLPAQYNNAVIYSDGYVWHAIVPDA